MSVSPFLPDIQVSYCLYILLFEDVGRHVEQRIARAVKGLGPSVSH